MKTLLDDPQYGFAPLAKAGGWRRVISAPMLKDGVPVGTISVGWAEPGQTPQRQIDLLKTFADQAVIAIENVRLFNETQEALERQTATAEVLQVISKSVADAQPVFEKITRKLSAPVQWRGGRNRCWCGLTDRSTWPPMSARREAEFADHVSRAPGPTSPAPARPFESGARCTCRMRSRKPMCRAP